MLAPYPRKHDSQLPGTKVSEGWEGGGPEDEKHETELSSTLSCSGEEQTRKKTGEKSDFLLRAGKRKKKPYGQKRGLLEQSAPSNNL